MAAPIDTVGKGIDKKVQSVFFKDPSSENKRKRSEINKNEHM